MEGSKIKKVGTREEVYNGLALRTAGNLSKNDIIKKRFGNKDIYISKKLSEKMKANIILLRTNNPNFLRGIQKKTISAKTIIPDNTDNTNNTNNTNNTDNNITNLNNITNNNSQQPNLDLINKQKISNKIKNSSIKTQKILFKEKNNSVKTVFYPELQGLNLNKIKEELKQEEEEEDYGSIIPKIKLNTSFTIEEFPEINNSDFE